MKPKMKKVSSLILTNEGRQYYMEVVVLQLLDSVMLQLQGLGNNVVVNPKNTGRKVEVRGISRNFILKASTFACLVIYIMMYCSNVNSLLLADWISIWLDTSHVNDHVSHCLLINRLCTVHLVH